ncbi:MAG: ATP-NAD kinase family protein [Candidatus Heimdallarchaeota archaeon]
MEKKAIGFLINPIAGMGGRVGLKGTDNVLQQARELGASPIAPSRAIEFLNALKRLHPSPPIKLVTCPRPMGEDEVNIVGFETEILTLPIGMGTSAEDTKAAVRKIVEFGIELIVFVGGDGTARDILDALQNFEQIQVLGVPSGVKMYSGIFVITPAEAAEVVHAFLEGQSQATDFEIMDTDETAYRDDQFSIRLYGYIKGPFVPLRFQGSKQISADTLDEHENQEAVARSIVESMNPNSTFLLGPGTTLKHIADKLGVEKTLLGVDIYHNGVLIKDVNEQRIFEEISDFKDTWIIVSPIGHQGMLFGRGNQQISPEIIKRVGKNKIIVVATRNKLQGIPENVLRVDTGDEGVDTAFRGYIKVIVDYREWRMIRVQ